MKEAKRLFEMSSSIAFLWVMIILSTVQSSVYGADPKSAWQVEWDRTVRAAEQEGQVVVSIGGYGAIIDSGVFQKTYPKI